MKKLFMITGVLAAFSLSLFAAPKEKVDKSILTTVEEDYDFIYEVVNNTSGTLTVANFITKNKKTVAKTADVEIAKGDSYQFKYNLKNLKKLYGSSSYLGCDFEPEGRWRCGGWMNDFSVENQIHRVKVTDASDPQYCMDAENIWDFINIPALEVNEENFDFIYEIQNNSSRKMTVAAYLKNGNTGKFFAKTEDVVLETGETYQFKFMLNDVKSAFGSSLYLGAFFAPEGKWRCNGWENDLNSKNKKHIVVVTEPANPNYCMDAENKWENLE